MKERRYERERRGESEGRRKERGERGKEMKEKGEMLGADGKREREGETKDVHLPLMVQVQLVTCNC